MYRERERDMYICTYTYIHIRAVDAASVPA